MPEGPAAKSRPNVTSDSLRTARGDAALSEFEGRYKVGSTTCTVKPIKMAFEVRWAKSRAVMRFFFDSTAPDGTSVFVSEDVGKGTDKFVFDDDHYNSGTFLRADGKIFAVSRLR